MASRFGRRQRRKAREKIADLERSARHAEHEKVVAQSRAAQTVARNRQLEAPFIQITGRQREFVQANIDELTRRAVGELHKAVLKESLVMAAAGLKVGAVSDSLSRSPMDTLSVYTVHIPEIVFSIVVEGAR